MRFIDWGNVHHLFFWWLVQAVFNNFIRLLLRHFQAKNNWQMVALLILELQLLSYACISGWKDAILWSRKGSDAYDWNEHYIFIAERACIGSIVFTMPVINHFTFVDSAVIICVFIACFSFLHNGFYYTTRRYIDVDYYHWFSESKASSARFNFGYFLRTASFFCGLIGFACYLYLR